MRPNKRGCSDAMVLMEQVQTGWQADTRLAEHTQCPGLSYNIMEVETCRWKTDIFHVHQGLMVLNEPQCENKT